MKHIILANPVSGNRRGYKHAIAVQKLLKKNDIDAEIILSKSEGDLEERSRKLAKRAKTRFYCIGGDGTLNEIISGIIGTSSEVVVLPFGTGNDFAKYNNKYHSLRKIILESLNATPQKVDAIKLNNNRYCINVLNIGFDALVAHNMNKFRWVPLATGTAKYNLSIVYTLFFGKNYRLRIKTNNIDEEGSYTLVALSNGRYYGGGVVPNPYSVPDDGKLGICKIKATTLLHKLILLPKYKNCEHEGINLVYLDNDTTKFKIVSRKEFPMAIDGEVKFVTRVEGEIIPEAVNIIKIGK